MRPRSNLAFLAFPLAAGLAVQACYLSQHENDRTTSSSTATGGAGGGTGGTGGAAGGPLLDKPCDPIVPTQCGFPFPSDVYLEADPTTGSGHRVAFPKLALPIINGEGHVDPAPFNALDGFSPGQAPMTDLPGATTTGLPDQNNIEDSLKTSSPTILLEAETGALIPHFAELDVSASSGDGDHAFMIRPAVRLHDASRYIVAIRRVVDANGAALEPSPAFKALRDGTDLPEEPSVAMRRAHYADIFDKLGKAGIQKDDLQIAWDYTTSSRRNNTEWLVHMRDDALATVGEDGPEYTIDSVDTDPNEYIHLRIHGTMTVPLYLDKPGPGGRLVFGDDGLPKQNGTAQYPFLVHVPKSAFTSGPFAVIQNGHGLLGGKTEGQNTYLAKICEMNHFIAVAVDLIGMADEDTTEVQNAIGGDIGNFQALVERQHQGILNSLLAMRLMKGRFAKDPLLQVNGQSIVDTAHAYYRGDSQGGIFGTTYMALSTDVTRGLLGEPGMPYNLLLNRSADFTPFFELIQLFYKGGGRDVQIALGLVQMLWDRTEPNGYAPYIAENMLPNTPQHQILIQAAIGDQQVTPLGAHLIARAVHAQNLKPVNRSIYGIPEADAPFSGSGFVEFKFVDKDGNPLKEVPQTNTPPEGPDYPESNDPHDWVRKLDAARDQTEKFLREGVIDQFCGGPCVFQVDPQ